MGKQSKILFVHAVVLGAMTLGTPFVSTVNGAEIVVESRDSVSTVSVTNLGLEKGYIGGGDGPFVYTTAGLTSADDLGQSENYYYGPDSFDQVNGGSSSFLQDFTLEDGLIGFELSQIASASGDASPLVLIQNDATVYFAVSETVTAMLSVGYDGNTNVGNDTVVMRLRRVGPGANPAVLETLFTLATHPDPTGQIDVEVELLAGERYRIVATGKARSFDGVSPIESLVDVTITLPGCPADFTNDGVLNFFDVSAFLAAFASEDPSADFTDDGVFNFFDVSAFLAAFAAGCP